MKNIFILILFIAVHLSMRGQEKLGIVNSNYHPVSSIHQNASSSVDSRSYMQLNLAGANVFATSNAAYLPQFSFMSLITTRNVLPPVATTSTRKKFLYGNVVVDGPSFMLSKNNFGVGLFTRARSVVDVRRVPYEFTDLLFNPSSIESQQTGEFSMNNARISNMSWLEYGVNFGMMAYRRQYNLITIGGNIKYLTGINLVFVNIGSMNAAYGPGFLNVADLDGKIRTAAPAFGSGKGYGLDLGVTYKKMLSHVDGYKAHSRFSNCAVIDYKYKIGLSLRDAGYISYRGNTRSAEFQGSANIVEVQPDTELQPLLQNNFNAVFTDNEKVRATLPTALSAQADYNFENNFYFNITANKNIVLNSFTGVQSSDLISIAPRFETRNFEVAVPFTMQRFLYPQLGFAFRVRSFVLGFDNVVPWVMKRNTSTLNVYFNLTISLFRNPSCRNGIRGIDDCFKFKWKKSKIKRKNTMISPRPRKK